MKELVDGTIRVQIDIDPPQRADFLRLFPSIDMPVALAPLVPQRSIVPPAEPDEEDITGDAKRATNALAHTIHRDGYLRSLRLWDAIEEAALYTKDAHTLYIRSLPCLFAPGRRTREITTAWNLKCQGEVCGHHTPSASLPAAGEGKNPRKVPAWFQVPLCKSHHDNWAHGSHSTSARKEEKQHLVAIAVRLMAEQAERVLKEFLGIESLNDLTENLWASWIAAIKLE
jgi:hypothetical protein